MKNGRFPQWLWIGGLIAVLLLAVAGIVAVVLRKRRKEQEKWYEQDGAISFEADENGEYVAVEEAEPVSVSA